MPRHPRYRPDLRSIARRLRGTAPFPERLLWSRLRRRRLGARFLRQQPIAGYVVDFYCPDARLVVELDGRSHLERGPRDLARQQALEALGYTVLRFWNDELLADLDGVVDRIRATLEASGTSPPPP